MTENYKRTTENCNMRFLAGFDKTLIRAETICSDTGESWIK